MDTKRCRSVILKGCILKLFSLEFCKLYTSTKCIVLGKIVMGLLLYLYSDDKCQVNLVMKNNLSILFDDFFNGALMM